METSKRTIDVGGTHLHVEERGSGPPLLLLHGLTGTGSDWRHVFDLDLLARTRRVITPDARGHGRSTNPAGDFTFKRCARDVLAILDALDLPRAQAIGLSLGAKTLLHAATLEPDRLSAMILVSPTPRLPDATRALYRAAAAQAHSPEEWAAMRGMHVFGDEQIAALWQLPARFADDAVDLSFTPERLRRITARTLVVSGDSDPLYPVELAVEVFRGIPGSSLCVVPGGGHGPIFSAERDAFVSLAMQFLGA
jgi:pimeloyl-ACP methyl ester carboxylesterase